MLSRIKSVIHFFLILKIKIYSSNYDISFLARIKKGCVLEGKNKIMKNVILHNCKIGFATYVAPNTSLLNTDIGRYCSIGSNIRIVAGNHPSKDYVSTSPLFYSRSPIVGLSYNVDPDFLEYSYANEGEKKWCVIGNDVWIGSNVIIANGVTIGDGAIIATGSVVNKDVLPYSIAGGIPAKHIRFRFKEDELSFLLHLKWWEKDEFWIRKFAPYFSDISKLQDKLGTNFN